MSHLPGANRAEKFRSTRATQVAKQTRKRKVLVIWSGGAGWLTAPYLSVVFTTESGILDGDRVREAYEANQSVTPADKAEAPIWENGLRMGEIPDWRHSLNPASRFI